jgi:alkylated DNA repair protein alkB family protein 6
MTSAPSTSADLDPYKIGTLPSLYLIPDYISPTMEQHFLTNILATQAGWKQVSGRRLLNLGGVVSDKGSLLPAPMPSWGIQSLITELSEKFKLYNGDSPANHVLINTYGPGDGIMSHQDGPLYFPKVAILSLGASTIIRFIKKRSSVDDGTTGNVPSENNNSGGGRGGGGDDLAAVVSHSVVLPPRSLFIFKDDAYEEYLHGIDFVEEEIVDESVVNPPQRATAAGAVEEAVEETSETEAAATAKPPPTIKREGTRVSLTIRRVLKVHSLGWLRR